MDFTREPIIETVITPKEGCKLVVRSSHASGQEEFFVDAVQVVSFGHSFFFRSQERPKTFLVPVSDYEIVEVREARMVLKNVGIDRNIKIAGGREGNMRPAAKEPSREPAPEPFKAKQESDIESSNDVVNGQDNRLDKRRDRRRNVRKRRGRDDMDGSTTGQTEPGQSGDSRPENSSLAQQVVTTSILHALLPPPPRLISETIEQYRDTYKDAFYSKEKEEQKHTESKDESPKPTVELNQPEYGSYEMSPEEEEAIYILRKRQGFIEEAHKDAELPMPESTSDAGRFLADMEENRPSQDI